MANFIAAVKRIDPPHIVKIQLKIFTPVGMAMSIVVRANTVSAIGPMPDGEHVVRPHAEAQEADQDARSTPSRDSRTAASARTSAEPRTRARTPAGSGCRPRGARRPRTGAARAAGRRRPRSRRSSCRRSGRTAGRTSAIVMTGNARMSSNCTTNDIHVNIGMRIRCHARRAHVDDRRRRS